MRGGHRRREDDPERSASGHSWHPGEFGVKFLDFRSYDGDVALERYQAPR
jgi:hypothetical protein